MCSSIMLLQQFIPVYDSEGLQFIYSTLYYLLQRCCRESKSGGATDRSFSSPASSSSIVRGTSPEDPNQSEERDSYWHPCKLVDHHSVVFFLRRKLLLNLIGWRECKGGLRVRQIWHISVIFQTSIQRVISELCHAVKIVFVLSE